MTFRRVAAMVAIGLVVAAAARSQDTAKPERGEQIVTTTCTTCHDTRAVDTQALDEEGWTKVVMAEIGKGAKVQSDEVPVLVAYLTRFHGPLPDGPGKAVVLSVCTQCHDL